MFTVKIMNEFIHSPLWIYDEDGIIDEPEFIANDAKLQDLCSKVENMFSSYYDVITAMGEDLGHSMNVLKVDGGAAKNSFLMQFQSDILGVDVSVPMTTETTALGVAYLAGLATGVYKSMDEIASYWQSNQQYKARITEEQRETLYGGWKKAIAAVRLFKS